jgi:Flp pilus assembly pilin Flp
MLMLHRQAAKNLEPPCECLARGMTGRDPPPMLRFKTVEAGRWDSMLRRFRAFIAREQGQTMAEYAVVLSVITIATLAAFTALSGGIQGAISNVTGVI